MTELIPLKGFSRQCKTDLDDPGVVRRESDRAGVCNLHVDAAGSYTRSVLESTGRHPVTIFTLGRFSLLINGQPAYFGPNFPECPLELLKAIIAEGGREIITYRLATMIWPYVDGDKAMRSFDTTLHRLRKILNHEGVLMLRDGKLSLDARYCWVDVWTFERSLGEAKRLLRNTADSQQVQALEGLTENLLALYQSHFLIGEEEAGWSVSMRECLRHKFIHHLIEVGKFYETHGYWGRAIQCYQKGIDVDDLVEVFYRRLMNCYLETQRLSEGMLIYRRCCHNLSIKLSLQPELETESLYRALKNARLGKQKAGK